MQGQVIGVATLQLTGGQSLNFAVPVERIVQLKLSPLRTLAEWTGAAKSNARSEAERSYNKGLGYLAREDYRRALPYFEEAVNIDPIYAEAWFQIGTCNYEMGQYRGAIAAYKKAINVDPDFAEAYTNLGNAYSYLDQPEIRD